ncbi:hypothetical protein G7046_g1005 [Stylonectria norvegica]|nr:hypothetical protein G7046_g1005 [Stylonectria norvegica]
MFARDWWDTKGSVGTLDCSGAQGWTDRGDNDSEHQLRTLAGLSAVGKNQNVKPQSLLNNHLPTQHQQRNAKATTNFEYELHQQDSTFKPSPTHLMASNTNISGPIGPEGDAPSYGQSSGQGDAYEAARTSLSATATLIDEIDDDNTGQHSGSSQSSVRSDGEEDADDAASTPCWSNAIPADEIENTTRGQTRFFYIRSLQYHDHGYRAVLVYTSNQRTHVDNRRLRSMAPEEPSYEWAFIYGPRHMGEELAGVRNPPDDPSLISVIIHVVFQQAAPLRLEVLKLRCLDRLHRWSQPSYRLQISGLCSRPPPVEARPPVMHRLGATRHAPLVKTITHRMEIKMTTTCQGTSESLPRLPAVSKCELPTHAMVNQNLLAKLTICNTHHARPNFDFEALYQVFPHTSRNSNDTLEMDETANNASVLKSFSAWAARPEGGFAHIQVDRAFRMSPLDQAKMLIDECKNEDGIKRIIYAAGNHRCHGFSVIHDCLNIQGVVDVYDHGLLYETLKKPNYGGVLEAGCIIIYETDIHYSLEFTLAMAYMMDGVEKLGVGRIVTISHQAVDKVLMDAMELIAPAYTFHPFRLHAREDHIQVEYHDIQNFSQHVLRRMTDTIQDGKSVLIFGGPRSMVSFAPRNETAFHYRGRHCVIIDLVSASSSEVDHACKGMPLELTPPVDGYAMGGPAIFLVYEPQQVPREVKNLGLVVIARNQQGQIFDDRTTHITKTSRDLSQAEFDDALAHAYLSNRQVVRVMTDVPRDGLPAQMPFRRIENDQNLAFLFEASQMPLNIHFNDLIKCLLTRHDVHDLNRRLMIGGWVDIDRTADCKRMIKVTTTDRTRRLINLLPTLKFNFAPAAFLAGFKPDDTVAARRAAIRIAVIQIQPWRLFPPVDITQLEAFGISDEDFLNALPLAFRSKFSLPGGGNVFRNGWIWTTLAVLHTAMTQMAVLHSAMTQVAAEHDLRFLAVTDGPLGHFFQVQVAKIARCANLVERLEEMMFPLAERISLTEPLDMGVQDCDRIHDELLSAWMFHSMWLIVNFTPTGVDWIIVDMVNKYSALTGPGPLLNATELLQPDIVANEQPDSSAWIWCLALETHTELPGARTWSATNAVAIPLDAVRRWERASGQRLHNTVKTTASLNDEWLD